MKKADNYSGSVVPSAANPVSLTYNGSIREKADELPITVSYQLTIYDMKQY